MTNSSKVAAYFARFSQFLWHGTTKSAANSKFMKLAWTECQNLENNLKA